MGSSEPMPISTGTDRLFRVEELAGRDASGAPRWKLVAMRVRSQQTLHMRNLHSRAGRHSQISLFLREPGLFPFASRSQIGNH